MRLTTVAKRILNPETAHSCKSCAASAVSGRNIFNAPAVSVKSLGKFAETASHGALPWKADHDRRSVLYKYASRAAARAVGKHFTPQERYGDWTNELTPEQQAVLYGPGVHDGGRLPILDSDGEKVWIAEKD